MAIRTSRIELILPLSGGPPVALAHREEELSGGRWQPMPPVDLVDGGEDIAAFKLAWGAAQQAQIASLTQQLAEANAAKSAAETALAERTTERDKVLAEVARLTAELEAILNPPHVPLIPTTVIRRIGFTRFGAILEACKSDPQLNTLVQFMLAAREISSDVPEFAQGIQYVVGAGYATQSEVDAWFAPVTTP
jgi:hypothetical protein